MIRLHRNFTPLALHPDEVERLTKKFTTTGASVWNFDELKNALLKLSCSKCAYCECNVSEESKYMEVEHFVSKTQDPSKVVEWNNLLPSCKRCNSNKGTHDVVQQPILNPCEDEPKQHLKLRLYRFRSDTAAGIQTIGVVDLNNAERAVKKRFEIGQAIHHLIDSSIERLESFKEKQSTRLKNKLVGQVEGLLEECQRTKSYAATAASVLHSDPDYSKLRKEMIAEGLWSEKLEELHKGSESIALDCT